MEQLRFDQTLAAMAQARGLAAALNNDLEQVPVLEPAFDLAVNEPSAQYDECDLLTPLDAAGKPVLHLEYDLALARFCLVTRPLGFSSLAKNLSLDSAAGRAECGEMTGPDNRWVTVFDFPAVFRFPFR